MSVACPRATASGRLDDDQVTSVQLGRPARVTSRVAVRCHFGLPVVVVCPPMLPDGAPFPTRYWLTCPLAQRRVARLEAGGGVRRAEAFVRESADRERALARAHVRHARDRDRELPPGAHPRPRGGVAGSSGGIKCLHAHLADHLAGHENPVGRWVTDRLGALDCRSPCVLPTAADGVTSNPEWREGR